MNARLRELERRRLELVQRSARQRRAIAGHGHDIVRTCVGVERGIGIVRQLTTTPALVTGAGVLLLTAGPSRLLRWASRALLAVTLARRAMALWSRYSRAG